jgi:hypothetical protein
MVDCTQFVVEAVEGVEARHSPADADRLGDDGLPFERQPASVRDADTATDPILAQAEAPEARRVGWAKNKCAGG